MVTQRAYTASQQLQPASIFRCIFAIGNKRKKKVDPEEEEISLEPSIKSSDIIVCARGEKIYAVHKEDGCRLWRIKSPIGSSGGIISIYVTEDYKVLLGAKGKTACIELRTGKHVWTQKMKRRWICNEVSILSTPSRDPLLSLGADQLSQVELLSAAENQQHNQHKQDDAGYFSHASSSSRLRPSSYAESASNGYNSSIHIDYSGETENKKQIHGTKDDDNDHEKTNRVVCATSWGRCYGFDIDTGDQLWCFNCPKGRLGFPTILLDGRGQGNSWNLFIACNTMLYCLEARTGKLQWSERLSNSRWSFSAYVTLATGWSSRLAAEAYSGGFCQQPLVQIADVEEKIQVTARLAIA
ncbi:hypothetical protein BDB00DRAFT_265170 [Zychaea mexicana]|uniref:uncharacterized protein n=1 Tax=Zychaea mexicana TaxID=64656 RepID=UPI0022FDB251|nr:uncharacterized protein BDB00DRAFT_265170 [Zychaea mexicana]KAI9469299.1 hypothetical protein BDB00DRAFT_265170 [Zychaea mexicana]